ncbi:MAG TPA: serine hydrolase domain-containing protein [Myxococcota bacterium]|nr:serine hydrolase domain-containing protein [Myxococcota bacterium]
MFLIGLACTDPAPLPREPNELPDDDLDVTWPERPEVDALVLEEMERAHIPGVAACTLSDFQVDWCQGYGWAELETETPATEATPFLLASVSKTVIAVTALEASRDGQLALDAPLSVGFAVQHPVEVDHEITPRMLGSHVAGIVDNWDVLEADYVQGDSEVPLGQWCESYFVEGGERYSRRRNFGDAPEESYEYSNAGATLLAYGVEYAVGQDFADYSEERVFGPLAMDETSWHLATLDAEPAMPYTYRQGEYEAEGHYGFPDYPDGQLRSSARDLGVFLEAWGRDEDLREIAWSGLDEDQGFVWYRWEFAGEEIWGHNGGEVGVATEIALFDDGRGFVVLQNGEGRWDSLYKIEEAVLGL